MAFKKAKAQGTLVSKAEPYKNYEIYEYMPDTEFDQVENEKKATH